MLVVNFPYRLRRFVERPDFQQNPLKSLLKRIKWRFHWAFSDLPYTVKFADSLIINLPKSGSASLIYYQGRSEFETAEFVTYFLKPGMTFIDVGAHIGEYTLLAAKLVGGKGKVYAFEPQPSLFPILTKNVHQNGFEQVRLERSAVSDSSGKVEFEVFAEPSVASIRKKLSNKKSKLIQVSATSLDEVCSTHVQKIDLIKVDVEGAEKMVFAGAKKIMQLPPSLAPTWIFEYSPAAYSAFGYQAKDLLGLLQNNGYEVYCYLGSGKIADFSTEFECKEIINLIATKDVVKLRNSLIQTTAN